MNYKLELLSFLLVLYSATFAWAERPNVLFIIADDLNNDMSTFDHPMVQTPHLDGLAKQGLTFDRAYCNYPLCGPSRASFMSGLYPDQSGLRRNAVLLRDYTPNVVTMSQHFENNGYQAARVGKIYHYNNPKDIGTPGHDDPESWTTTVNPRGRDKDVEGIIESITGKGGFGAQLSWYADPIGKDEDHTDGMVATESIKLMNRYVKNKQPFFLAVGFYKPHTPFVAPKKYFDLYDPAEIKIPTVPEGYFETIPVPAKESLRRRKSENDISEEHARKSIHAYYATISFMDAQLGRVLHTVDELGIRDNTIIVFTSDHGYHMGEHGHWQKTTLFENADRIPLVISTPDLAHRGKRTKSLAEMVDFYPTLSELAGLNVPKHAAGVSLVKVLQDPKATARSSALTQYATGYAIRTDRYRYTRWQDGGAGMTELYDHQTDSAEMVNLAGKKQHQAIAKELDDLWEQRVAAASSKPEGVTVLNQPEKNLRPKKKNPRKQQ